MNKDYVFFGESGLTSTSANHIANIAKESYSYIEQELENINFINQYVNLIGENSMTQVAIGTNSIQDINDKLDRIAKMKALIAWLREAIKAKEHLTEEVSKMPCEYFGIELPEAPERPTYIDADDVIATWDIKKRNRYYYLEAHCATLGSYIHPKGNYNIAREEMHRKLNKPKLVSGSGRDTVIYTFQPSISVKDVEDKFMELQNLHRSCQAELNSMKHEIQTAIDDDKMQKDVQYQKEYSAYSTKRNEAMNKLQIYMNAKYEEVKKLKIVIPDSLKPIYEEVSALGKEQS